LALYGTIFIQIRLDTIIRLLMTYTDAPETPDHF